MVPAPPLGLTVRVQMWPVVSGEGKTGPLVMIKWDVRALLSTALTTCRCFYVYLTRSVQQPSEVALCLHVQFLCRVRQVIDVRVSLSSDLFPFSAITPAHNPFLLCTVVLSRILHTVWPVPSVIDWACPCTRILPAVIFAKASSFLPHLVSRTSLCPAASCLP